MLTLFSVNTCAQNSSTVKRFTPDELCSDVDFFVSTLDQMHVDPYSVVTRAEFRRRAEEIKTTVRHDGDMTQRDFWLLFAPLVNSIGDSHTFINDYDHKLLDDPSLRFLPLFTEYRDGLLKVTESRADEQVAVGSVIKGVNGFSSEELLRKISAYTGGSQREKMSRAGNLFNFGITTMLGMRDQFEVTLNDGHQVSVRGLTLAELQAKEKDAHAAAADVPKSNNPITLKFLDGGVAYLESKTFSYDVSKYKSLLAQLFTQIQAAKPAALVIDLRQNGGGNSELGEALIAMFDIHPYRSFGGSWKRSAQYAELMRTRKIHDDDSLVRDYFNAREGELINLPADEMKPEANPLRYQGPVYVLSGEYTFSSALMFVAEVKDNHLATVVGQETLEPACHYGELYFSELPNTKLRFGMSVKKWIRPSGVCDGGGVKPDFAIKLSPGPGDPTLDALLKMIKQGKHFHVSD